MRGLSYHEIVAIKQRIRTFQERVGYTGDYDSWIADATPAVTEGQVNFPTDIPRESTPESFTAFCCAAARSP
jgi:hypothetical protein